MAVARVRKTEHKENRSKREMEKWQFPPSLGLVLLR